MKSHALNIKPLRVFALFQLLIAFSSTAAVRLDEGLALHLPLTADLKDHSPAANPIEIVGSVRIEPDGAFFSGRKDWLEAPHIALNKRPFAIGMWIRETTEERTVGLVEQFDLDRSFHHFTLLLRGNRQPYFSFYVRDMASPLSVSRAQEWVHLVFQYTGRDQQIWINGRLICSQEIPPYEGETGVTAIGKVPRWSNVPGKDFVGYMRDFRIYQRTLSYEEIGVLAGIDKSKMEEIPKLLLVGIPQLSEQAIASRATMTQMLSTELTLPFLEINGQQIIVNGRSGQVYSLESSGDLNGWSPVVRLTNQAGRAVYDFKGQQVSPNQFFRIKVEGFGP